MSRICCLDRFFRGTVRVSLQFSAQIERSVGKDIVNFSWTIKLTIKFQKEFIVKVGRDGDLLHVIHCIPFKSNKVL